MGDDEHRGDEHFGHAQEFIRELYTGFQIEYIQINFELWKINYLFQCSMETDRTLWNILNSTR